MKVVIPYTKYEFQPPAEIDPEKLATMRSMEFPAFKLMLEHHNREEMKNFIAGRPLRHRISMIAVSIFGLFLLYYALSYIVENLTPLTFKFPNMDGELGAIIFGAFLLTGFVVFLGCRSHLETYSSFQRYLRHKKRFYLKAKKQLDKAA